MSTRTEALAKIADAAARLTTPTTGMIRMGDIVRIGKGKANWKVTAVPSGSFDGIAIVSEKGAYRALDTAETLTVVIRDGVETITAWLAAEMEWMRTRDEAALTVSEMDAIEALTANTVENQEDARAEYADWELDLLDAAPGLPVAGDWDADDYDGTEDDSDITYVSRCVVCAEFPDYCQGHGEIGDPEGYEILIAHDNDTSHTGCHPDACEISAVQEAHTLRNHVDYPHEAGYLHDCAACEDGPCVCGAPCMDAACVHNGDHLPGARFQHNAPCVSGQCEHPETLNERAHAGEDITGGPSTPETVSSASEPHSDAYARGMAHSSGDHSLCSPELCDAVSAPSEAVRVTAPEWRTEARTAPTMNRAQRRAARQQAARDARARDKAYDRIIGNMRAMGELDTKWYQP